MIGLSTSRVTSLRFSTACNSVNIEEDLLKFPHTFAKWSYIVTMLPHLSHLRQMVNLQPEILLQIFQ